MGMDRSVYVGPYVRCEPPVTKAKPQRIQRKREKGWKMPKNTLYVGRPSKWGNPYSLQSMSRQSAVECFRNFVLHQLQQKPQVLAELRGKNLACWCAEGEACHADVLLELANQPEVLEGDK